MIRPAGPGDAAAILEFLARDRIAHVYLEALVREGALENMPAPAQCLVDDPGSIAAVSLTGPNVVIAGESPDSLNRVATYLAVTGLPPGTLIKSPRAVVDGVWPALRAGGLRARWDRIEHRMEIRPGEARTPEGGADVRRARPEDLHPLVEAGAAMYAEDLGTDPRAGGAEAFTRRVALRIDQGRQFVWTDPQGGLCFQAYLSAITPVCVQVQGVYVPPERRGRGLATRGMAALAAHLLERHPCVSLCVAAQNVPAVRVYERTGFRTHGEVRAILLGEPAAAGRGEGEGVKRGL